ncbi:hypothetical protein E2562_025555 [Oryza meyeriana var. granulata]|uniref:Uncharacterized protein n=1 Tax=Oryza meyeriana var. granulata TaxID=110450 RepID=A0A6G1FC25_9ORYZ|nr:hypothetical protein E2562_025555 [Oryza meyeriana var. granulata]
MPNAAPVVGRRCWTAALRWYHRLFEARIVNLAAVVAISPRIFAQEGERKRIEEGRAPTGLARRSGAANGDGRRAVCRLAE